MDDGKKYMSLSEVAQRVGISYSRLWYYLISGRLPEPSRVGRARVFNAGDVALIEEFFSHLDGQEDENPDGAINL
jgi:predicted DNA-binding transcriptional regulator AlpA